MAKKVNKYIEAVEIDAISSLGYGIARIDGKVIFVPRSIPGDVVDVRVMKLRSNYDEGKVAKVLKKSPFRAEAFCSHFGTCGGCKWQDIDYENQLKFKKQIVIDAFRRIADVDIPEIEDVIPAPEIRYYRNKLEYTFSNKRWLDIEEIKTGEKIENLNGAGFHIPGRYDKIMHIEKCFLQNDFSNEVRNYIYDYAVKNELSFFDLRKKKGFLRNLIVRNSTNGELLLLMVFFENMEDVIIDLMNAVQDKFPEITSLQYMVNSKLNDTIYDQEIIHFHGKKFITETIGNYSFRLGAKSFFQTNTRQAENLYKLVSEFAEASDDDTVWDLYSGVGSIALYISGECKEVIGIEQISEAVKDAEQNALDNGVKNVKFVSGDVRNVLEAHTFDPPDIIITDPPRAGMHPDVIKSIMEASPGKIVYVSCNPATQARDLIALSKAYKVEKMQSIDMFPHTTHIENVALLTKR